MTHRDLFDIVAPVYDLIFRPPRADTIREFLALPTRGRLLDVGGGTGRHAWQWINAADLVVVADASRPMVSQTRRKPGLRGVSCLAERLPFPHAQFERVVMVDAFHHLIDQAASLEELWRVVAPGGRLVIEEPDIHRRIVRWVARAERMAGMRSHFVPVERIASSLAELGGEVELYRGGHAAWVVAAKPTA